MKPGRIYLYFFRCMDDPLGLAVGLLTGSYYTHVAVGFQGMVYDITYLGGSRIYLEEEYPYVPDKTLSLACAMQIDVEIPMIVLDQKISLTDELLYFLKRTFGGPKYSVTQPVINCVTTANIILNHIFGTNHFNGYKPDDLYRQARGFSFGVEGPS